MGLVNKLEAEQHEESAIFVYEDNLGYHPLSEQISANSSEQIGTKKKIALSFRLIEQAKARFKMLSAKKNCRA